MQTRKQKLLVKSLASTRNNTNIEKRFKSLSREEFDHPSQVSAKIKAINKKLKSLKIELLEIIK